MANIYSNRSTEWLNTKIEQLQELLTTGASSVSYNGVTTTYTKPENMRLEITEMSSVVSARALKSVSSKNKRSPLGAQYPCNPAGKGYSINNNNEDPFNV